MHTIHDSLSGSEMVKLCSAGAHPARVEISLFNNRNPFLVINEINIVQKIAWYLLVVWRVKNVPVSFR